MAGKTKIQWTEQSWNPVVGCSILSPGCTNCYAMKMAARIEAMNAEGYERKRLNPSAASVTIASQYDGTTKRVNGNAVWTGKLALAGENTLLQPLKRKKPTTYFVNSMGDLFHEDVPDKWIDKVFAVMALCPQHTFQVLTKRAKRMRDYFKGGEWSWRVMVLMGPDWLTSSIAVYGVLENIWLGVSTERQQEADERIPLLLQTPAAVRFISAEPLLGPLDIVGYIGRAGGWQTAPGDVRKLDWVIVGGESGPNARPMHPDWARSLRRQCEEAVVPFFFKQFGEWSPFYDRDVDDPDWRNVPQVDNQMGRGATRWHNLAGGIGFHGERLVAMRNVGKKAAGRLLDGIEHNAMPGRIPQHREAAE